MMTRGVVLGLLVVGCAGSSSAGSGTEAPPEAPPSAGVSPDRAYEQAARMAREGDLEGAVRWARQAIAGDPKMLDAYLLLGSSCDQMGDLECSWGAYESGLEALPHSSELLRERGLLRLQTGDAASAIRDLEAALVSSESAEVRSDLAFAYLFAGEAEKANELSARAVQSRPDCFLCWMARAEILSRSDSLTEAVSAYRQALQLKSDPDAQAGLAKTLFRDGKVDEAHRLFEELALVMPEDLRLRFQAGQVALAAKRPEVAVRHLQAVARKAPDDRTVLDTLMKAQTAAGDETGAARTRQKLEALATP